MRGKDLFDNATPAGGSLAATGLLRLAAITGERRHEAPAVGALRLVQPAMARHPGAFAYLLGALEWYLLAPVEVAIVGDPASRGHAGAAADGLDDGVAHHGPGQRRTGRRRRAHAAAGRPHPATRRRRRGVGVRALRLPAPRHRARGPRPRPAAARACR